MEPIPISEHYEDNPCGDASRYPIDIYQCLNCSAVQTLDEISPEFLWKDYTYFSGMTAKIKEHFSEFVDTLVGRISPHSANSNSQSVLDIGCNDGSLLELFRHQGFDVIGIDPADTVTKACAAKGIRTYVELFNKKSATRLFNEDQFSLVTAFNVFAHSNDLDSFLQGIKYVLEPEGVFCFEVQYLGDVSQKHILGTFFHEHMVHYSVTALESFLGRHGFEIVNIDHNHIQMGSIIVYSAQNGSSIASALKDQDVLTHFRLNEQSLGIDSRLWSFSFREKMLANRHKAQEFLQNCSEIAGYGAARSGPSLAIQNGISEKISALFDDHPSKTFKYSPFKGLKVQPSSELSADTHPITVILAYLHFKPILRNHKNYINHGGKFILLWPDFIVVDHHNYREFVQ